MGTQGPHFYGGPQNFMTPAIYKPVIRMGRGRGLFVESITNAEEYKRVNNVIASKPSCAGRRKHLMTSNSIPFPILAATAFLEITR